ncbi:MAG: hypothetical protein PHW43_09940 [Syntrophales bacterium]|nr:hypothetical protein [Syntrophales bacterium]
MKEKMEPFLVSSTPIKKGELFFVRCDSLLNGKLVSPEKIDDILKKKRDRFQKARKKYPDLISENLYFIDVSFDLPLPLKAKFIGVTGKFKKQIVEIESNNRKGYFVRGEPLTISTSSDPFYFCIPIYPKLDHKDPYSLTDRGLCWVSQGKKNAFCHLTFVAWDKNPWKKGQIAEIIRKARSQAISEIEKALNSAFDFSKIKQPDN